MTSAVKPLFPTTQLTNAAVALYTCPTQPPDRYTAVMSFMITNTAAAAHTVTIHNVPAGGSPTTANQIMPAASIPANTVWVQDSAGNDSGFLQIPAGGSIQALADANGVVNLSMGGAEFG